LRLLQLLTTSLSPNEMAQALEISRNDVLGLVESIYAKLGLTEEDN
jgi:DNA-binding CsgD family transcriptional regulator